MQISEHLVFGLIVQYKNPTLPRLRIPPTASGTCRRLAGHSIESFQLGNRRPVGWCARAPRRARLALAVACLALRAASGAREAVRPRNSRFRDLATQEGRPCSGRR